MEWRGFAINIHIKIRRKNRIKNTLTVQKAASEGLPFGMPIRAKRGKSWVLQTQNHFYFGLVEWRGFAINIHIKIRRKKRIKNTLTVQKAASEGLPL